MDSKMGPLAQAMIKMERDVQTGILVRCPVQSCGSIIDHNLLSQTGGICPCCEEFIADLVPAKSSRLAA